MEKCCSEVLRRALWRSVGAKRLRIVLEKGVVEKRLRRECKEVLEDILHRRAGQECWRSVV